MVLLQVSNSLFTVVKFYLTLSYSTFFVKSFKARSDSIFAQRRSISNLTKYYDFIELLIIWLSQVRYESKTETMTSNSAKTLKKSEVLESKIEI